MADSLEQRLINAVMARMALILTSNGYETNVGQRVEDSRPNWPDDELPALSVFEGTVTSTEWTDENPGMIQLRTMPVMVKGFWNRLDTATADAAYARKVIKDIYRAIRLDATWIDSIATRTSEKQHGIEYAPDSFEITGCQVEFEIAYRGSYMNLES